MKIQLFGLSLAAVILGLILGLGLQGCAPSEEDRMVSRCCECLKEESEGRRFRDCMGEDYDKLGEYDHAGEKEKRFTKKVHEECPDLASDFHL